MQEQVYPNRAKSPTIYQRRAQATRRRRQAAGRYQRPSKAQKAAFARLMSGRAVLTIEEMGALATHPHLHASQRAHFATLHSQAVSNTISRGV